MSFLLKITLIIIATTLTTYLRADDVVIPNRLIIGTNPALVGTNAIFITASHRVAGRVYPKALELEFKDDKIIGISVDYVDAEGVFDVLKSELTHQLKQAPSLDDGEPTIVWRLESEGVSIMLTKGALKERQINIIMRGWWK